MDFQLSDRGASDERRGGLSPRKTVFGKIAQGAPKAANATYLLGP